MYTVMIVEDEVFVSAGLKNMIRWSEIDMTVIGEARNGKEGLEMYYQKKPDIILTDVKMPVMDGIDMISRIREHDTTTRIVVLSCYEDYEMVRNGFKLGISDYILKVKMMPEDIENIMRKVYDELQHQPVKKEESASGENLTQTQNDRMESCKEYITHRTVSDEKFRILADELNIPEKGLAIGIMEIFPIGEKQYAENQNLQNQNPENQKQGSHTILLLLELIQKLFSENCSGVVLWEKENRYLFVLHFPDSTEEWEAFLRDLLQRITTMVRTYINRNAVFGISSFADSYEELHRLYTEAVQAEQEAVFLGETAVYYGKGDSARKYRDILKSFKEYVTQADWLTDSSRRKILKELSFQENVEKNDIDTMKEVFRRWIHRVSFDSVVQTGDTLMLAVEASGKINYAVSLPELIEILEKYAARMLDMKETKLISAEVAQAVRLIKQCYYEEDFSCAEVAHKVGMNRQYFSSLFKKEIGEGFVDYLNRVRISKACELLENTTMRSYEISQIAGFRDESYFSRVFKKVVGVRPNEYRRLAIPPQR